MLHVAADDAAQIGVVALARGRFAARGSLAQMPVHLGHQAFGLLHLFPAIGLKVFLAQRLDGAVSRSLCLVIVVVIIALLDLIRWLPAPRLALWLHQLARQARGLRLRLLALARRKAQRAAAALIIALDAGIIARLAHPVLHLPEVEKRQRQER